MTTVVLDGVTFQTDDFLEAGYLESVVVGGVSMSRFLGLFEAALRDIGKAMVTTGTCSINLGTVNVGDSVTVTLDENRPYRQQGYVNVVDSSTTSKFVVVEVTNSVTATTLNGTVKKKGGSGTISTCTVALTGRLGDTGASGAGALADGGIKTANFTIAPNTAYIVDLAAAAGNVTATLDTTWSQEDEFNIHLINTGGTYTLTIAQGGHKIRGSAEDATCSAENAAIMGKYKNTAYGFSVAVAD